MAQSRDLPHFDGGELAQFITFRLDDALPGAVLLRWKDELKHERPGEIESVMRRRVEAAAWPLLPEGAGDSNSGSERLTVS
jgi:hypothetical protein